ncbi:MAG: hypothetical protein QOI13_2067 [Paraburkholderia sp.]|jgi:ribosomal protein S18 acetylase RimI-like enzyme|nr:hypothetical protein [Paraburkholderia sp.]
MLKGPCYAHDLSTSEAAREKGVATALTTEVYSRAKALNVARVVGERWASEWRVILE